MENELLKTFDEEGNETGIEQRSVVHQAGHWHETFHCWFVESQNAGTYLYFQLRSSVKKDYANLLDITAAGHILSDESPADGLREVEEELGITLAFDEVIPLGLIKDELVSPAFIDRELCHVYLYDRQVPLEAFKLQREEVAGIFKVCTNDFKKLWFRELNEIEVAGFIINDFGEKILQTRTVARRDFVPHEDSYIESVIKAIDNLILKDL
ncbi:NUDIX hydrolase [Mesobacillus subterraneus]|uniref:NUDIX hydrolase n=1 Tax=Mesobacillus subterraneus TaxID=285983 RepID=UPI001FECDE43|nr:NUDIX domain-containing protein [Mesobacillus subterraneus]